MIIKETFEINGRLFTRIYSNNNRYVVRDGIAYEEACDPAELGRTYIEGDTIENVNIDADKAEAYDILLGGVQ